MCRLCNLYIEINNAAEEENNNLEREKQEALHSRPEYIKTDYYSKSITSRHRMEPRQDWGKTLQPSHISLKVIDDCLFFYLFFVYRETKCLELETNDN